MSAYDVFSGILQRHADTTSKYSAPQIVQAPCPWCGGIGKGVELGRAVRCRACNGHGWINIEAIDVPRVKL